jgi:hypothetical protein
MFCFETLFNRDGSAEANDAQIPVGFPENPIKDYSSQRDTGFGGILCGIVADRFQTSSKERSRDGL